ncbi:MAG: hypothetical protein ABI707_12375 [Ferruginibacter sp.]
MLAIFTAFALIGIFALAVGILLFVDNRDHQEEVTKNVNKRAP